SEVLGLRRDDVDLTGGHLIVAGQLDRLTREDATTRTAESERQLVLPERVVTVLRAYRRRQAEAQLAAGARWHDSGYLFTTAPGAPLRHDSLRRAFVGLVAKS